MRKIKKEKMRKIKKEKLKKLNHFNEEK